MKITASEQANTPTNLRKGDDATLENWAPDWAREQWAANGNLPPVQAPKGTQLDRIKTAPYEVGYSMSAMVPLMWPGPILASIPTTS